jgi:DNA primase
VRLSTRCSMTSHYPSSFLKMLRNRIPIDKVIVQVLNMSLKPNCHRLRFCCPKCYGFHTATSSKTNLARCFDCKKNFNPIDLVMAVAGYSFVEAVEYLKNEVNRTQ